MTHTNGVHIDVDQLAVSPNLPDQIPALLQQISCHGKAYLAQSPQARLELLEASRALTYALETPREAIIRHCWSEVRRFLLALSNVLYVINN